MKLMKPKMLLDLLKRHVLERVSAVYVWIGCTIFAACVVFNLSQRLLQTGELSARLAFERGQRVIYHIAAGEVDGTPRHTKRETEVAEPVVNLGGKAPAGEEAFTSREGLAPAPFDAITEQTEKGLIPTAGRDGTLPWKYYARPYTPPKEPRPMVAILMTNLGLSKPLTEEALKLPHTITLSFSPYASDAKVWAKKARGEGFEALVDLPMEPLNFPIADPGPYGLLNSLDTNEISNRTHWILSRYPGFVGLLAPAAEKLTGNLTSMRSLLTELTARGVLLIYMKTPQNVELATLIKNQHMTALGMDEVLDEDLTPSVITTQLDALAEIAKKQGYAIGVAHSYPPTLRALNLWIDELDKKGVDLVPVSAIAKKILP